MDVRHLLKTKQTGFNARLGVEGKGERRMKYGFPVTDLNN